jgi:transposase-like protein
MAEKALTAVIQEAYVQGILNRSVDDLSANAVCRVVKAMGMSGISKSQVSRLCEEIDGKVKAFLDRPIEGDWPYLWIDATYLKVRRGGRIVSVAVIIAVGVNSDGRREVLGMEVSTSEAEPIWTEFLRKLTRRGLRGVKLVVSDAHEGLKAAVTKVLSATWQRCRVHFMRNVLAHAGKSGRRVVSAFIATAFAQETPEAASAQWRAVADQVRPKVPKLAVIMDDQLGNKSGREAHAISRHPVFRSMRIQIAHCFSPSLCEPDFIRIAVPNFLRANPDVPAVLELAVRVAAEILERIAVDLLVVGGRRRRRFNSLQGEG